MISIGTGHVDHSFAEGFWLIELSMRNGGTTGRRYLCQSRNNREAFRIGERLRAANGAVRASPATGGMGIAGRRGRTN